ncbi:MAG TPA: sigma-54 dependent transcriptional regulator [Geopsychrobacteraceae bacterium]|nr:sigma-54 dependent transcriptional regulator [Geopsychrobacteraceae bacterium]
MDSADRSPQKPILLVDDEQAWLHSMSLTLATQAGLDNLILCTESNKVRELVAQEEFSLVLLDLTMPHPAGEDLLTLLQEEHPELPVIILSGINQLERAVDCMRLGAFDYYVKTEERKRIVSGVQRALRMRELQQENELLRQGIIEHHLKHPDAFEHFLSQDAKVYAVFHYLEAVASSTQPVLITGESGTGKELAARAVHNLSRPEGPWVAVNVAGLDGTVFSDTLFGHTAGAFTGAVRARKGMIEEAAHGTLFLDEIGDLSPESQVKLLRLLQENEYHPLGSDRTRRSSARIVVATNRDLAKRMEAGHFRRDLYYRLTTHHAHLPSLRQRPDDLPLLLRHFLQEAADSLGRTVPTPPAELPVLLSTYHFPGNVRELRSMVFDAVSLHRSGKLSMQSFKDAIGRQQVQTSEQEVNTKPKLTFSHTLPTLDEATTLVVEEAMSRSQGNQTIAAAMIGISRPALNKRLKKMREEGDEASI